ncbi:thermonuclease family protein [Thiohalorhabdus sp.]|uniref:thermonuclease family protein n=1 Tax=Thiohalorhabdus sp. TaxID=3094134 RepID=UPI002FC37D2B
MLAALPSVAADGIFRWTDEDGQAHFGDRPPPDAERLDDGGNEDDGTRYRGVERIPDGDTIHLADGTEVRVIGINAPEVAHRDDPAEAGGPQARRFLQALVAGKRVRLTLGAEATDKYDRTLAHVFLEDGTNVAKRLLAAGHAFVTPRPPNTAKARAYSKVERQAREANRGLWDRPHYAVRPAAQSRDLRNTFRRLRGRVATVTPKRKYVYLGFASGLQALLPKDRTEAFNQAGKGPEALLGRTIVVRGWVRMRNGSPRMRLFHSLQVETVP